MVIKNVNYITEKEFDDLVTKEYSIYDKEIERCVHINKTIVRKRLKNCIIKGFLGIKFVECVFVNCRFFNIYNVDFYDCSFTECDLKNSTIKDTCFTDSFIYDSNFLNSNIKNTSFKDTEINHGCSFLSLQCPEEGSFIGYKKINDCDGNYICKLLIPKDAKRSSATSRKCRCSKAKVLEITDLRTGENVDEVHHNNPYKYTLYKVGEFVYPDEWDDDRFNECSHGIHFFITKKEALDY